MFFRFPQKNPTKRCTISFSVNRNTPSQGLQGAAAPEGANADRWNLLGPRALRRRAQWRGLHCGARGDRPGLASGPKSPKVRAAWPFLLFILFVFYFNIFSKFHICSEKHFHKNKYIYIIQNKKYIRN